MAVPRAIVRGPTSGDGPRTAIVAGRGLGYRPDSYRGLCRILEERYEVHIIDNLWRASVEDSVAQVGRYVEARIHPRLRDGRLAAYYLAGHSYGGRNVLEAAPVLDPLPRGVVAMSPAATDRPGSVLIGRALAHHNAKLLGLMGREGFRHALGITLGYSARFLRTLERQLERLDDLARRPLPTSPSPVPGLILLPARDALFPEFARWKRRLQEWYPAAVVALLPEADHDFPISYPAAAAGLTEACLGGRLLTEGAVVAEWRRRRKREGRGSPLEQGFLSLERALRLVA